MTSLDSIGSCSLDAFASGSEISELPDDGDTVSARTLRSVAPLLADAPAAAAARTPEYVRRTARLFEAPTNGTSHQTPPSPPSPPEPAVPSKKPSYLGLACSLSGYGGLSSYDSKLREGFRARDRSPAPVSTAAVTAATRPHTTPSPGGRDGLVNGVTTEYRKGLGTMNGTVAPAAGTPTARLNGAATPGTPPAPPRGPGSASALRESSRHFMTSMLADETDYVSKMREPLAQASPDSSRDSLSPGGMPSPQKRSPGAVRVVEFTSQHKSYVRTVVSKSSLQTSSSVDSSPYSSLSETTTVTTTEFQQQAQQHTMSGSDALASGSPKSFIQQRIERLYGPGALAQGFFSRTRQLSRSEDSPQGSQEVSSPQPSATASPVSAASPSLPVLRHLRPEFRAQLPLTPGAPRSPQRAVPAVEQVSSYSPRASANSSTPRKPPVLQSQVSIESLSDSQPAAPDVPVLPPSPAPHVAAAQPPAEVVAYARTPSKPEVVYVAPAEPAAEVEEDEERNGHYYLKVLREEVTRLTALVETAEAELNGEGATHLPEEALGKLRAASGKARLLMKQKLQQFEGLCHKNISQSPEEVFPTTDQDLAGFWDMVKLQVDHVDRLFVEIDRLRAAGWVEVAEAPAGMSLAGSQRQRQAGGSKRRVRAAAQTEEQRQAAEAAQVARKAREEARRKLMEERRRAMKQKQHQQNVEIYVPHENGK